MRMRPSTCCRAFSLIEASVVVLLMGILAVGAVPAFRSMGATYEAGAIGELERAFVLARATAMATGVPTGVSISSERGQIRIVRISDSGREAEPLHDVFGSERDPIVVAQMYGGVKIGEPSMEGRRAPIETIWFGHRGEPEERSSDASLVGEISEDIVIRVGTEGGLRIRARSGLLERGL